MPPVNTSASSTDVDNEATAELPVLDVAAYESTLETIAHTDTWAVPAGAAAQETASTVAMPVIKAEAVSTLRAAEPSAHDPLEHSGTLEMPALPKFAPPPASARSGKKNKADKITATALPAEAIESAAAPAAEAQAARTPAPAPIVLPPSPPLIEELRNALSAAERRIEELNERERIGDAERSVAVARANAESAQLREQLGKSLEALHTAHERLGVQSGHV
jgi:hypothetical protein